MTISQYKQLDAVDFDEEEAQDDITDQLAHVVELAKTLSSSMFVGKAKGESLEALGKLFLLGMEFAFSEGISSNITFLNALSPYVKLLQRTHLQTTFCHHHVAHHLHQLGQPICLCLKTHDSQCFGTYCVRMFL